MSRTNIFLRVIASGFLQALMHSSASPTDSRTLSARDSCQIANALICPSPEILVFTGPTLIPDGCGAAGGPTRPLGPLLHALFPQFANCCNGHDTCFGDCPATFEGCNTVFERCMKEVCSNGPSIFKKPCDASAHLFHWAVSTPFGCDRFNAEKLIRCKCGSGTPSFTTALPKPTFFPPLPPIPSLPNTTCPGSKTLFKKIYQDNLFYENYNCKLLGHNGIIDAKSLDDASKKCQDIAQKDGFPSFVVDETKFLDGSNVTMRGCWTFGCPLSSKSFTLDLKKSSPDLPLAQSVVAYTRTINRC